MKRIIVCLIMCVFSFCTIHGQTWEEWTQQKETRIKRLMEQIAANQIYIGYAQKGYRIVSGGLHTIRDIKDGEVRLHFGFIDSLKVVNPKVKSLSKVSGIISSQAQIIKSFNQISDLIRESNQFTPPEMEYCRKVFDDLFAECLKNIDQLLLVISNGQLSMNDDERIRRINLLYQDMLEKSAFTMSFCNEIGVLALQRLTEQKEIDYSKRIQPY